MPMFNNRVIKIPEKLTIDSTSQFQHITHCLGRLEWRMACGWQSSDQNPGYPVPGPALWEDVHGKTREGTFGQCQRSLTGHAFLETARRHRPISGPFSSPSTYLITASTPVLTVTYLKPGCLCCRRTQQGFVLSCSRQFSWTIWGSASQPLREFACEWAWLWSHWWDGERSPSHSEANESINPSWPSFPGRIPRLSPPPTSTLHWLRRWALPVSHLRDASFPGSQGPLPSQLFLLPKLMLPGNHSLFCPETSLQMDNLCCSSGILRL